MKPLLSISNRPSPTLSLFLDRIGLSLLFTLLIANPFHFFLFNKVVYYREMIAGAFIVLTALTWLSLDKGFFERNALKKEFFLLVFFPMLLVVFAAFDPGRNLYGSDVTGASLQLKTIPPTVYVLRNAFIYLPMLAYFYLRGLSEKEIRQIAFISMIVAPFSVLAYLYHEDIATIQTLKILARLGGGSGMNYNSYVPYLTFSALSAFYLMATDTRKFIKLLAFCVSVIISVYVLVSTSRQSTLFIILCGVVFLVKSNENHWLKKLIVTLLYVSCTLVSFHQLTTGVELHNKKDKELHDKLRSRYTNVWSAVNTPRLQIALDGLNKLTAKEFITGAGLSSVINAGPHNDYIRWLQRIGLLGMIIGFSAFYRAAFRVDYASYFLEKNTLPVYVLLAIFFTLYHSMFGYPREDAYQSLYCFLGMAMWLGIGNRMVAAISPIKSRGWARFIGWPAPTLLSWK